MSRLAANIAELGKASATFGEVIPEMDALKSEVLTIMGELEGSWHGEASEVFVRSLRNQADCMENVKDLVADFQGYANSVKKAMEEVDRLIDSLKANALKEKGGGGRRI